ncbi:MAG TPA: hypothetical protein VGZ27_10050 [Vicinamibacterales bacterium]|jgi:hypothetical protein|nr:hypothetical protein [Vicinamibacterales bacterium]
MPSTTLTLELVDVDGEALGESVDVLLRHQTSGTATKVQLVAKGKFTIPNLLDGVYSVQVHPLSYRPVGMFAMVGDGVDDPAPMVFPVDPVKVTGIDAPAFTTLLPDGQRILQASTSVKNFTGLSGAGLYDKLDDVRKAGFLNILQKSNATAFDGGRSVASYFQSLTEMQGDRFFAAVHQDLPDATANSVHSGLFHPVDEALHTPPPGFDPAGSFKTQDLYGNLQLTFFSNGTDWISDTDIDDAQGILHIFQVVGNWVTGTPTNPYDIHEILVAYQQLDPGYELKV